MIKAFQQTADLELNLIQSLSNLYIQPKGNLTVNFYIINLVKLWYTEMTDFAEKQKEEMWAALLHIYKSNKQTIDK